MHRESLEQELLKMRTEFEDKFVNFEKHEYNRYKRLKEKVRSGHYTWQDKYEVIYFENNGSFQGCGHWNDGTLR